LSNRERYAKDMRPNGFPLAGAFNWRSLEFAFTPVLLLATKRTWGSETHTGRSS
jgi:hypothetical protein